MSSYEETVFDIFWYAYPRKEDKKKARKAFDKLNSEQQHKAINDCVNRFNGIEKCFIPLPTTYLNGERWEDDPIPKRKEEPEIKVSHPSHRPFTDEPEPENTYTVEDMNAKWRS